MASASRCFGVNRGTSASSPESRCHHRGCLEGRGSSRSGRQRSSNRVADPGHVVVRNPFAQVDNRRRKERFLVYDVRDVTSFGAGLDRRVVCNNASDNRPRTDRNTHARTDRRQLGISIGNAIREGVEVGYGDGDGY